MTIATRTPPAGPPARAAARAHARAAWADLRDRLATVTPAALGRAGLGLAVVATVVAAVLATWPALLPFAVGGLLAYAVLPVVDALDRILPRSFAAVLSMLAVLALAVGVLVIVVPPLTSAIIELSGRIPSPDEIDAQLQSLLGGLPEEARTIAGPILVTVAAVARDGLGDASGGLRDIVGTALQAALGVAGAILGLIVLPAWMLTVMTTNRRGGLAIDRRLAGWFRADFWAVIRMLDRAAGTYLRGFVVVAFAVAALAWLGLMASPQLGGPTFEGPLALATFAGAVQVIPELGPLLGFIPALLLLAIDPERAAVYTAVYLVARFVANGVVGGRLVEGRLNVPRAILIPGVVVLSQVGPLALLLSAPILAFGSDFVRYLHGRLSEPPRPAGVLPGEAVPVARGLSQRPAPVPVVYRRRASAATAAAPVANAAAPVPTSTR